MYLDEEREGDTVRKNSEADKQTDMYRVFLKKVLHKREGKMREKNEDDLAEWQKFGTSTTTM